MSDPRDTIPSPPGPGVDPELVEAFAHDVEALAANAEGQRDGSARARGLDAEAGRGGTNDEVRPKRSAATWGVRT